MAARTIRTNLLGVVVAALIPLILIAAWQIWLALDTSRELVATRLRANASLIAEEGRDPFVIARHSLSVLAGQKDVLTIGANCNRNLADALRDAHGILNFLRTDADGKARCSVRPISERMDMSGNSWWLARQGRMNLYLSQPQVGTISKQPVLIMVQPLAGVDGSFVGTVSAAVSVTEIEKSLAMKRPHSGSVFVVDRRGEVVIGSGAAHFGRFAEVRDAANHPHTQMAKDGQRWTYVSTPLFADELHVVYAEPARLTWQAAMVRIWPSLLLPVLALLFTSTAIWFATDRLILRWLEKLRQMTARFARGEFDASSDDFNRAPTELAQFADDLEDMAEAIEQQEDELRNALTTTMSLTREVNHRVKNNLQIVTSLLTLQSERVKDPVALLALSQARSRIAALGLIHRLLYDDESRSAPGHANMKQLIDGLCAQLRHAYRERSEIDLDCSAQDIALTADQAVPVTLFTVEAVTNAFQHAFGEGRLGKISVAFTVNGMMAEMRVSDNGSGFTDIVSGGKTGIDLIRAYAGQAGGTMDINSASGMTSLAMRFALHDS